MGGRRKDGRGGVARTLTAQQEAVAVDVAGGMRMAEAMMKHGYSETYARNRSVVLLDNVCFQRRLTALRAQAAAPIVAQLTRKILSLHECQEILSTHVVTPGRRTPAAVAAAQLLLRTIPGAIAAQETHLTGEVTLTLAYDGGRTPRRALESGRGQKLEKAPDAIEGEVTDGQTT